VKTPVLLSPLRHDAFRLLWGGMAASYAGDRLQELAQAWLMAILTQSSALSVGLISILASLPQLFMPVGGAVADQLDRRRLLIAGQLAGAAAAVVVGALVLAHRIAPWHIYAWAFVSGMIWLAARPAYKVVLTEAVPSDEVRSAVALNSMTETTAMLVVSAGGSMLLALVGLPIAFLFNSASYLIAAASLWRLPGLNQRSAARWERLSALRLSLDLRDGIIYLARQPTLLYPLLLTFVTVVITTPSFGLLAAVVHKRGGSIISLGLLGASVSLGAFIGAVYAGSRGEGDHPIRRYALYGTGAAAALVAFAITPMSFVTPLPLAVIGFILFSEAVWNTSRVRLLAAAPFQARLQSITTMAFTLGNAIGQLWGGIALDRFGVMSLVGGAIVLVVLAVTVWSLAHRLAGQKAES
jgi:predicted MFS family arabinose efflux permease